LAIIEQPHLRAGWAAEFVRVLEHQPQAGSFRQYLGAEIIPAGQLRSSSRFFRTGDIAKPGHVYFCNLPAQLWQCTLGTSWVRLLPERNGLLVAFQSDARQLGSVGMTALILADFNGMPGLGAFAEIPWLREARMFGFWQRSMPAATCDRVKTKPKPN